MQTRHRRQAGMNVPSRLKDPIYRYAHRRDAAISVGRFVPNELWPSNFDNSYTCLPICHLGSPRPWKRTKGTKLVVDVFFGPRQDTKALYYLYLSLFNISVRLIRCAGITSRWSATIVCSPEGSWITCGKLVILCHPM